MGFDEFLLAAFERLADLDIDGYLFNCTTPEAANAAITELKQLTDRPIGCYVNRIKEVPKGWTLDNEGPTIRRTDLTQDYFVELSMQAIDAGATIVGGCCEVGPAHIRHLAAALRAAGHDIA